LAAEIIRLVSRRLSILAAAVYELTPNASAGKCFPGGPPGALVNASI